MVELQGRNVYLIGMPGSGKSTIAQLLAEKLGYSFDDTDTRIVDRATELWANIKQPIGNTTSEIFQTVGEPEFRKGETQALAEVSAFTRSVIATGGGTPIAQKNWHHLHQGVTIWLDPMVNLLVARLDGDRTRPLLIGTKDLHGKLTEILVQRHDRYAMADVRITIDRELAIEEIVDRIFAEIHKKRAEIFDRIFAGFRNKRSELIK